MRIFRDDADYRQFLNIFGDIVESFELDCWNYCVMPNHYHATLVPARPNLSEALRHLNSRYAQWWNRRRGRVGHVFQGRFKDQIVQHEEYLLALCRYVVMNPVRARLTERPEDWPWSSYRVTAGLSRAPVFLSVRPTLLLFGDDEDTALRARFVRYVASREDPGTTDRIRSSERILGTRSFKESFNELSRRADAVRRKVEFASVLAPSDVSVCAIQE